MTAPATREALWERLRAAALVDGPPPAEDAPPAPWYVRAMLVAAGWLAAALLVGFVSLLLGNVLRTPKSAALIGLVACGAAAALLQRSGASLVVGQVGLAISIAGQALLLVAYAQWLPEGGAALAVAVQQAVLLVLVPHFLHRAWAAWTSALALAWAGATVGLGDLAQAAVTAACLAAWHGELTWPRRGAFLRVTGAGLALAVAQLAVWPLADQVLLAGSARALADAGARALAGRVALVIVLLGAALALLHRERVRVLGPAGRAALLGAAILAALGWRAPGVATAAALLVVGFAAGSRALAGLGIAAVLGALGHFYYALDATLLQKASHLAVCGVALLAARIALEHVWAIVASDHA
jgi:hypothetical protein